MVCLPEMRRGSVAVCLPTILVRARREIPVTLRSQMDYGTQEFAACVGWAQRHYYELLERRQQIRMIGDAESLEEHNSLWKKSSPQDKSLPIGCILSMEGADPILTPDHLAEWWDAGLRVLSLVHYGKGPYAAGTASTGPVTERGRELLKAMDALGMILDVTHLSDEAFDQALDLFDGPVMASHSNCRAIAPNQRQLSDDQIRRLIDRNAVIGVALDIWMMRPWSSDMLTSDGFMAVATNSDCRRLADLSQVTPHIDHICQIAGNTRHVAIGSDLDGGFGTEQAPGDMQTIADLQQLANPLEALGYNNDDINGIFYRHWFDYFMSNLPRMTRSCPVSGF